MRRLVVTFLLVAACSSAPKSEPEKREARPAPAPPGAKVVDGGSHRDESEHEELPSKVQLSDAVVRAAGVKTAAVQEVALPLTVNLTGELISDPDRTAKIAARVSGRFVDVRAKEGDHVKAGALLALLESSELARARAAVAASSAKAQAAHQNLERLERVAAKGLAAGQEVASAQAEAATLDAEVRAARQTLGAFGVGVGGDGARMELRTPVAGFVLSRDAVRGQTVTPEHIAFVVADLDQAYFTAKVFEKDLARVRVGAAADVRLNAYPNETFAGTVESVGRALDPVARTVLARVAVQNRNDLLKVGLFGTVHVVVADSVVRTPRPVVPLSSLTQIANRDCVFVRQPDGDFEVHRVTLGRTAAGKAEVVAGLRAGEQVVVDGVFTLKSAVLKSTFGEGD